MAANTEFLKRNNQAPPKLTNFIANKLVCVAYKWNEFHQSYRITRLFLLVQSSVFIAFIIFILGAFRWMERGTVSKRTEYFLYLKSFQIISNIWEYLFSSLIGLFFLPDFDADFVVSDSDGIWIRCLFRVIFSLWTASFRRINRKRREKDWVEQQQVK